MSLKPDRTVALSDEENDKQLSDKDQSPQLIVDQGMVHALREAHRVLKPAGLLIDLRPRSGASACQHHMQWPLSAAGHRSQKS